MTDTNENCSCADNEEFISLFDIWRKLVQYKKTFLLLFLVVFILGSSFIFLKPPKYIFTQVFEIGKYGDGQGRKVLIENTKDLAKKIKLLFFPEAVRKYNLQAKEKIDAVGYRVNVEDVGAGTFILSANGNKKNESVYKFLFAGIIDSISRSTQKDVGYRKKNLSDLKDSMQERIKILDEFYKELMKNGYGSRDVKIDGDSIIRDKLVGVYLKDQMSVTSELTNRVSMLQSQIDNAYNTREVSSFIVSDDFTGPSKFLLLVSLLVASLFFAFFGIFLLDFIITNYKLYKK